MSRSIPLRAGADKAKNERDPIFARAVAKMSSRFRRNSRLIKRLAAARGVGRASIPGALLLAHAFARAEALAAAAARTSCLKAASSILSPSRMSIARRTFPSRLELNSFAGSSSEAPRWKVSFTTCLYVSPVQRPPSCSQTGVPIHFHASATSGTASWISRRIRARVSPRQSANSQIRPSIFAAADSPSGGCVGFIVAPFPRDL